MDRMYPVYTLKNECHDCYKCVRECPVKAIKIQEGHASVIGEKCVDCGHCVSVCPAKAKRVRSDFDKAKLLIASGKKVYASLAPSWAGIYDIAPEKMIAALKNLGFTGVSETALGAQEVSIKTTEILNNAADGLYISGACPVIDDYIRLYKPEFAENILPIASPALTHAALIKKTFGKDSCVVFIGPCIAKKNESDRNNDLIDVAITFNELNEWIKNSSVDFENIIADDSCKFVPERAYEGGLYPLEGGMNETIRKGGINSDITLINVSSIDVFAKAINGLDRKNIKGKIFVEGLACFGGCLNGPCSSSSKAGIGAISDILSKIQYRRNIPKQARIVVEEKYIPEPVSRKEYNMEEITNAMKRIGKNGEEDELNCGGCGYHTCRDLAAALLSGDAEPSMCVSYMRKTALRKAAAMIRCMPSAIVIVNKNMKIVETNDAFLRLFCPENYEIFSTVKDGLSGAELNKIVPFVSVLQSVIRNGKDVHKEHYPLNGRLYDINAFEIETGELAGAVITDVTESEMDREKIARRAKEVIKKNIATVQNIACLLGEHMVETELLLSSIAEDFEIKKEDED